MSITSVTLQWRHIEHDSVWKHQPHHCLLSRLFRHRSKQTSKLSVTGLCEGNSPVTGEFPAQRASNAEKVSICWRHHDKPTTMFGFVSLWTAATGHRNFIRKVYNHFQEYDFLTQFTDSYMCYCVFIILRTDVSSLVLTAPPQNGGGTVDEKFRSIFFFLWKNNSTNNLTFIIVEDVHNNKSALIETRLRGQLGVVMNNDTVHVYMGLKAIAYGP